MEDVDTLPPIPSFLDWSLSAELLLLPLQQPQALGGQEPCRAASSVSMVMREGGGSSGEASFSPAGSSSAPWSPSSPDFDFRSLMRPAEPGRQETSRVSFLFPFSLPGSKRASLHAPIHKDNPSGLPKNGNSGYAQHPLCSRRFTWLTTHEGGSFCSALEMRERRRSVILSLER